MAIDRPTDKPRGFTLIELVAVIVVLAVLSGVAIPKYYDHAEKARVSAAKAARSALVGAVQQARLHNAVTAPGVNPWPANLNGLLQSEGPEADKLLNPYLLPATAVYCLDHTSNPNKWHPELKTVQKGFGTGKGSIWYNPHNGAVRYRVRDEGSSAATLRLYNEINECNVASLGATGAG